MLKWICAGDSAPKDNSSWLISMINDHIVTQSNNNIPESRPRPPATTLFSLQSPSPLASKWAAPVQLHSCPLLLRDLTARFNLANGAWWIANPRRRKRLALAPRHGKEDEGEEEVLLFNLIYCLLVGAYVGRLKNTGIQKAPGTQKRKNKWVVCAGGTKKMAIKHC